MTYRKMGCAVGLAVLNLLYIGPLSGNCAALAPDGPKISITQTQGIVLLSWPDWATNWVLEESPHLQRPIPWRTVSSSTNVLGLGPRPATNSFFRLRKLPNVDGLSGYWRFDEGTGDEAAEYASSGPVVFFTNAAWAIGRVGPQALHFNGMAADGSGSRAWVSNTNYFVLPPPGQPFAVSLWFSPDALTGGWQGLIGMANGGWSLALHTPGPGTNCLVFASSTLNVPGQTLLLPGQWYELTITHDGTVGSVYLDGNLLRREAGALSTDEGPICIGGGIRGYNSFLGRIDEVRTYRKALSSEEISLTGHWPFDENAGLVAFDSSINAHHSRASAALWAPGKIGNAALVSSNEVVIDNEHFTVLPPSGRPFSLSLWIHPYSLPIGRSGLMSAGDGTNSYWELAIEVGSTGETAISFKSAAGIGTLDMRAVAELSADIWTKLDITYNGGIATLYVNGRKIHHDSGALQASRVPLRIGHVPGTRNFDGLIDDLRIYRRERGASEIGPVATIMWETVLRGSSTNIVLQGSGPAGKTLTYSILNPLAPTNGSITHADGSATITYHAGNRKGPDALIYTVSEGEFTSIPATLALSIVEPHWLSPTGGSIQPQHGSSPDQAWFAGTADALDAIWKTNDYYDCFFYAPGVYETSGSQYGFRPTARAGCKHIGAGAEGPTATTLRLVNMWNSWDEEVIFGMLYPWEFIYDWESADNFEVHNMVLDCNAANNPKYARGEPVWIQVPLTRTALVQTVTLRWNFGTASYGQPIPWTLGPASQFRICQRVAEGSDIITNCTAYVSTGHVDVVEVGVVTDEILIQLDQRADGVDFYSIAEIQVDGGSVILPTARTSQGTDSRLIPNEPAYSILQAIDGNPGTAWASGFETNVQIVLPVDPDTPISALNLHWNCDAFSEDIRLGPAAAYTIKTRKPHPQTGRRGEPGTGPLIDVPFARQTRTPEGLEINVFSNAITTDALVLVLTATEPDVNVYSLREVTLQGSDGQRIAFPFPKARDSLGGSRSIMSAFDGAPESAWGSLTQGMIGALNVVGNNLKFTRLKVIGFGTKAAKECFPFYIYNMHASPRVGNILVEDCVFSEPATNNGEGISVVNVLGTAGSITNALVRRCTISGIKPHFPQGSHGFSANLIEDCVVDNCEIASYFEPHAALDYVGPVILRSNRFLNVDSGLLLRFHPGRQFGPLASIGNEIVLNQGNNGFAIGGCDLCGAGPSGSITNLTAIGNLVRYSDWLPRPANAEGGFLYTDIQNAVFANNIVALGTSSSLRVRWCPLGWLPPPPVPKRCPPYPPAEPPTDQGSVPRCIDTLPPGYRRAWLNNRTLSGALIPVIFHYYGADRPALQQQAPDELP
jgi:hypothetical protein